MEPHSNRNESSVPEGSRFLASTLHEVRTPIQTIISTTELLQDTKLDREQREYVHQIEFSANALLELANDVLDFTKIRSSNFKLENIPYDVIELSERVADLVSIEAFNKHLEFITDIDYSIPRMIMGDPTRVQQIILNLIKNAVKFTMKGFIVLRVRKLNNALLFEIIDSGIGVEEQKQKLIFNDFYQVDASTTRKFGGSGLGLTISKNLVEAMKGKIGIYSDGKMGSNFWFTIPLEPSPFEEEEPKFTDTEKQRILIVDNSHLCASSFARKLKAFGITNVETVYSGEQALKTLRDAAEKGNPFTIAFIDLLMPVMGGWHLSAEINKDTRINNMRLYLTVPEGQMGKEAKMKMLNWFNGYIYKPIKRNNLVELLNESFTQKVDLEAADQKQAIPVSSDSGEIAAGKIILVAEDHPVNRKLICTFLEKFGAKVLIAENGEEAVQQVKTNPQIDLIFMDILMPVKSGIDATLEIRQMNFNGIIIACTANNDPEDFETYKTLGINDILLKPFKREAIRLILEKWETILSFPEAKEVISLTEINNKVNDFWDISDLMETVNSNSELAVSLMDDYIDQTQAILQKLKEELKSTKDYGKIELYAHTLKGSSAAISATKLAEVGRQMNDAAKVHDLVHVEALRTNFDLDFIKLKQIVQNWKAAL